MRERLRTWRREVRRRARKLAVRSRELAAQARHLTREDVVRALRGRPDAFLAAALITGVFVMVLHWS